jgi:uncharacterized protein (TIGR03083 family)
MSELVTSERWSATRGALSEATWRFCELLRVVRDPDARAIGDWDIATVAAHVWVVSQVDTISALGDEPPADLAELVQFALAAGVSDVAELNRLSLERVKERDPSVLADLIEERVDDLLQRSRNKTGEDKVDWLGGLQISVNGVLSHLMSEFLVHGYDIARAEGSRDWMIPPDSVVLFFEDFLLAALRGAAQDERFLPDDARGTRPFSVEMRVRGAAPVVIDFDGDRLTVEDHAAKPADVRISADPKTMLLVMYERIGPLGPLLRGKLSVGGRRPWRLARFRRVVALP